MHYVVVGELSGNRQKMQISVRLLDVAHETRPVWSDRFELATEGQDQLNELVTAPIVARIDPVISIY